MNEQLNYLNFARNVVYDAGRILKDLFHKDVNETIKFDRTIVTDADFIIQDYIKRKIRERYPNHSIISEESEFKEFSNEFVWILDPIDGTNNFSRKVSFFNISLALTKNKETIVGVVYNPITDEMFYAIEGNSWFNGKEIKKEIKLDNKKKEIKDCFLGFCYNNKSKNVVEFFKEIHGNVLELRKFGAAALEISYVAVSRLDGFIGFGVKIWDFKAAELIAKNLGIKVLQTKYKDDIVLVVAKDYVFDYIINKINKVNK